MAAVAGAVDAAVVATEDLIGSRRTEGALNSSILEDFNGTFGAALSQFLASVNHQNPAIHPDRDNCAGARLARGLQDDRRPDACRPSRCAPR